MSNRSLIAVIDDDHSVRESLPDLLDEFGFASRTFESAEAFLESGCIEQAGCLVLDVAMPGMTGPELQLELERRRQTIPIIFISANTDECLGPRLVEQGAVACLSKPFTDTALLGALLDALATQPRTAR